MYINVYNYGGIGRGSAILYLFCGGRRGGGGGFAGSTCAQLKHVSVITIFINNIFKLNLGVCYVPPGAKAGRTRRVRFVSPTPHNISSAFTYKGRNVHI